MKADTVEIKKQELDKSNSSGFADVTDHTTTKTPNYKILHSDYDNGNTVYEYSILISPVNLNTVSYKSDVKAILDDIAKQKGTVDFIAWVYDNPKAATLNYNDLNNGQRLSSLEKKTVNEHLVAVYEGKLVDRYGKQNETGSTYTIDFYMGLDASEVGQHTAWKESSKGDRNYLPNQ